MTAPDDAVAAIDAALEAWESGPDAYRWDDDAEPGTSRGQSPSLDLLLDPLLTMMEQALAQTQEQP